MKQLIHTLYVTEKDIDLHLKGEALEAVREKEILKHVPLHNLESIVTMSYKPASPALMNACAERGISFIVLGTDEKYKYRIEGRTRGNPELRILQYDTYNDETKSLEIAKKIIAAKVANCDYLINKYKYNHSENSIALSDCSNNLKSMLEQINSCSSKETLRGFEGTAARIYFDGFEEMIRGCSEMEFDVRSTRPPKNPCNSLLSLSYTLLCNMCISALESVGLDPYIGVMHEIKSGKPSLALDIMEELRPILADRFVLRMINLGTITPKDFEYKEDSESFILTTAGIKKYFAEWEKMRSHEVSVDGCDEKIPLGLLPFFQAQKLSRYIYGKDEEYLSYSICA